jgi:hypothetical protein
VQGYDNGGYFHRVLHYATCDDGEDDVTQAVDRRRVELVHPAIFILISCNAMSFRQAHEQFIDINDTIT